ncbi:DUF1642 domain-containing protein [Tetragenococcus halophilus]|uniref:DUF1642 domain-containing protein n=1 Tax=Tetragenococcus halophilus TaxID=51669 RepID=UPI0030F2AE61
MDKQECLEILNQKIDEAQEETDRSPEGSSYGTLMLGREQAFSYVRGLLKTLDEPEKPEIPKFVADWIEEKRPYYSLMTMVGNYLNGFGMPERVEEWITDNKEDYLKALVIGYAIEKEPAWVVRINEKLYFCRFTDKYFEKDSDAPTYIESGNPSLIKKFTNKDKAEAVAILVDGTVEEWSE